MGIPNLAPGPTNAEDLAKKGYIDGLMVDVGTVTYVVHGSTAGTARPTTSGIVIWIGTVEPTNAVNNDFWSDL